MDFESSNNLLWDQNIIAHNLEYNINAELQRGQPRGMPRGPPSRPNRETFVGARQCTAHKPDTQPTNLLDSLASDINHDLTDVFGKNWQLLFLIVVIAVCVIQYVHYRHVTANLVDIIKLFMCQNAEQEFNSNFGQSVIQPVKLPSAPPLNAPQPNAPPLNAPLNAS
jgi:hypothetical protein